jgi:hypothetical protein
MARAIIAPPQEQRRMGARAAGLVLKECGRPDDESSSTAPFGETTCDF